MQVAVVSDSDALNQLKGKFGNLAVVVYVYSQMSREQYKESQIFLPTPARPSIKNNLLIISSFLSIILF